MDYPMSKRGPENNHAVTFFEQMREFLRRNLSIFLVAGLLLLVIQDIFGTHGVLTMRRAERQASQVKQEIQQLNGENQQLQDRVKSLKSDPQAIERIAREEMGLARPGEYVFKIPPKTGEGSGSSTQPAASKKNP
jgi:cell division protein FtsB